MSGENGTMSHISVFLFFFEGIPKTSLQSFSVMVTTLEEAYGLYSLC